MASKETSNEVQALKEKLIETGQRVFKENFPAKIAALTELMGSELLNQKIEAIVPPIEELTPPLPPAQGGDATAAAAAGGPNNKARPNATSRRKRRKLETKHEEPLASSENESSDSDTEPPPNAPPFVVPTNKAIIEVMEKLRTEYTQAIETVGAVKIWLQLIIPPIESGGQFSLQVIEECISELQRFEDQAYSSLESPSKYFHGRAKLVAKLTRHRGVMDYRQSLLEADELEYTNLKMGLLELRNCYVVAYDLLQKNFEKLQPQTSGAYGHMMT